MKIRADQSRSCADPSRRTTLKVLASAAGLAAIDPPQVRAQSRPAPSSPPRPTERLYHGAAYYPELWPADAVAGDIARMRELGINVVRMGEFAWSKMEPDEGRISLDFFRRVMDQLHAAGIETVFCTPTPTPPIWLTHGHPGRCHVGVDGRVMIHGSRQHASYDHPEVEAACFRIVEALARALGSHPGLIGWQIDNELRCHVAEDYSAHSIARWQTWLERRYGSIERLNEAWGAEIWSQRYQRFDQVPAPQTNTPFVHNASLSSAYLLYSRERIAELMDAQSALLRRHSRAPITHNMSLGFALHFERMCRDLDFASFDNYPSSADHRWMALNCDLFRPVKPGRAIWVMETSPAHNGWLRDHQPTHPPGFLAAEAVLCYGLGAEAFCYWLWRQQRTGCELPHSAVVSAWNTPGVGYESVKEVETARRELEPLLRGTRPTTAEVALTWSDRGRAFLQTEPLGTSRAYKVDHRDIVWSWHGRLCALGLHRDIRFEGLPLDGLRLLITPAMPAVDDDFLRRVRAFVEAGGVWIAGPLTGTRTTEHTVPTDAGLGPLEALAGVETVFSFPVTDTGAGGEFDGHKAPLAGWCHAFRVKDASTRIVGRLDSPQAPGLGYITERRLGRGAVVLLGAEPQGEPGEALLRALVDHYARQAGVSERYDVSVGTFVCPRVGADGRRLWIVVNLDGQGGQVTLPAGARDARTERPVAAGRAEIERYGFRVFRF